MTRVLGRAVLSCALVLLASSGCGDSEAPGPGGEPSSPASATTSSEPTEDATTAPADPMGPVLEATSASLSAPDGWKLDRRNSETNVKAAAPAPRHSFMGIYDYGPVPGLTLRELALVASRNFTVPRTQAELTFDGELGGERAYVLTGSYAGDEVVEFGAVHDSVAVDVSFTLLRRDYTPAERQQLIDSVLATFEWN